MIIFSQNLSQSLSRAIAQAEQQGYEVATPEHVLLALLDDPDAVPVMRACNVDLEKLRGDVLVSMPHWPYMQDLDEPDDAPDSDDPGDTLDSEEFDEAPEPIPIEHFQIVLNIAVDHAKTSGCEEIDSADVLVALLKRPVGDILRKRGLTRYDATTFICHGISKDAQASSRRDDVVNDATSPTFKVRLLNDNYTQIDFVEHVLKQVLGLAEEGVERVVHEIHHEGAVACGAFTREEAEAKVAQIMELARQRQHPFRCCVQQ
jgi:ATP-dependent Clp protease adapter protein ClpS